MRRRTRTRTALAVAAALALTGTAGCSDKPKPAPAAVAAAATPVAPERLTPQVAAQAFRAYVTNEDVARASGDERLALSWAGDGQSQLIAAAFRKAAFTGDPVPRYDYRTPRLYVPRLTSYPQWFVVVADRTARTGDGPAESTRKKGAKPRSKRLAIMAFNRATPASRWRLSLTTVLNDKAKPPQLAVDREGYATPLATFDAGLVIQPRDVPAIQATLATEGNDSVASTVMRAGSYTTGYYAQTRRAKERADDGGLAYDTVFTATGFPVFALRTTDGGGFVLYSLSQNTVTFLKNKKGHLSIPRDAAHLLDTLVLRDELNVTQTLQYGAAVPARPKERPSGRKAPKADVVAHDGAVTKAITRGSV